MAHKDVVRQDRIDELFSYMGEIDAIGKEMAKFERESKADITTPDVGAMIDTGVDGLHAAMRMMLEMADTSKAYFEEQIVIIEKISPPVSDYLYELLNAYEDAHSKVKVKIKKNSRNRGRSTPREILEDIDDEVFGLIGAYDELRNAITSVCTCIITTANFLTGDAQKSRKRTGR